MQSCWPALPGTTLSAQHLSQQSRRCMQRWQQEQQQRWQLQGRQAQPGDVVYRAPTARCHTCRWPSHFCRTQQQLAQQAVQTHVALRLPATSRRLPASTAACSRGAGAARQRLLVCSRSGCSSTAAGPAAAMPRRRSTWAVNRQPPQLLACNRRSSSSRGSSRGAGSSTWMGQTAVLMAHSPALPWALPAPK